MISEARLAPLTILHAASRASLRSGLSRVSDRTQVLASVTIAAIGCFTSCAREAVSSPMVVSLLESRVPSAPDAAFFGTFAFGYVPRQFRRPNHAAQVSFIGEIVRETSSRPPSLRTRTVSKSSTRSPRVSRSRSFFLRHDAREE